MKQQINVNTKRILLYLVIISAFTFNSCRVTLLPSYDSGLSQQIEKTAQEVDKFYLLMLETTSPGDRTYNKFSEQYVNHEVDLNLLLNKNKIRPLNKNSTRICEITLELWIRYKEEHKMDNTLSDGIIKLNRKTFSDLFYAMQVAEIGKDMSNKYPNNN